MLQDKGHPVNKPDSSRKYRTAKKIQSVAVRLAAENGINTVTAEAIAREAGISTRSFFNYYPYKEAALLGPAPDYPVEAVERFVVARDALVLDLKELTRVHLARFVSERRQIRDILRLAETDPKLKALRQNNLLARRSEMGASCPCACRRPPPARSRSWPPPSLPRPAPP